LWFVAAVANYRRFASAKLPLSAKQIMTLSELAQYLDVPRRRLYDLIGRPEGFPAFKVGRKWCADLDDVREWLVHYEKEKGSQHR
jgi:excisionase family DNA binding protein